MRSFRSKVFKQAYEMVASAGKSFQVCLSKAWAIYRLSKRMRDEIVVFAYEKADGTLRKAKGTLKGIQSLIKGTGKENDKAMRYFDVEANGFRSFRVENLITVY